MYNLFFNFGKNIYKKSLLKASLFCANRTFWSTVVFVEQSIFIYNISNIKNFVKKILDGFLGWFLNWDLKQKKMIEEFHNNQAEPDYYETQDFFLFANYLNWDLRIKGLVGFFGNKMFFNKWFKFTCYIKKACLEQVYL